MTFLQEEQVEQPKSHAEPVERQTFFCKIGAAVTQGRNTVVSGKVHESGQRRLAQLRGPAQRNLVLAQKFKREQTGGTLGDIAVVEIGGLKESRRQLKMDCFHNLNLAERDAVVKSLGISRAKRAGGAGGFLHADRAGVAAIAVEDCADGGDHRTAGLRHGHAVSHRAAPVGRVARPAGALGLVAECASSVLESVGALMCAIYLGLMQTLIIGGLFYLAALGVVARVRMAQAAAPEPGPGRVVLAQ